MILFRVRRWRGTRPIERENPRLPSIQPSDTLRQGPVEQRTEERQGRRAGVSTETGGKEMSSAPRRLMTASISDLGFARVSLDAMLSKSTEHRKKRVDLPPTLALTDAVNHSITPSHKYHGDSYNRNTRGNTTPPSSSVFEPSDIAPPGDEVERADAIHGKNGRSPLEVRDGLQGVGDALSFSTCGARTLEGRSGPLHGRAHDQTTDDVTDNDAP